MCPKKAKQMIAKQFQTIRKNLLELARDVEKSSDKNMSIGVPTVRKKSKD